MAYMTMEQFRQIHEEWRQSGLSVQQYCENIGIREGRFYYWKAKVKAEPEPRQGTCRICHRTDRHAVQRGDHRR